MESGMHEERFDRIDEWQRKADERFERIDERFDRIDGRFERIDERFERVDGRLDRVEARVEALHQRVGVLHKDVLDRIAATGELRGPTKREMDQGFADLREAILGRLDPLVATVRSHSIEIDLLKKQRG
jgi:archaellum component FlaC